MEQNFIVYGNMMLRYYGRYTGAEIDALSDEEWAEALAMLEEIRKKESLS
jgi:hypothetical protein